VQRTTILVIEDEDGIRQGVVDALGFAGYQTLEAPDGTEGLTQALEAHWDLLLLDVVLPGPSGLEILSRLRRHRPTHPVIVLTARGEEAERVRGLRTGADDYVVKPFSVQELLARVEAVLRRSPERPSDIRSVDVAGGVANFDRCEICFDDGERCDLSEREIDLLRYLARNPQRAISRAELLRRVWGLSPEGIETRTIDMHVARLREKLRDDPAQPNVILTVRGKGYLFAGDRAAGTAP